MTVSPEQILIFVALAVPIVTWLAYQTRSFRILRGFRSISSEVRGIAREMKSSEVRRDSNDIVVDGTFKGISIQVLLSHSDVKPGLIIRAPFPVPLSLSCCAKDYKQHLGSTILRTGDVWIDSRFRVMTDQPLSARILIAGPGLRALRNLCCSSRTFVVISNGLAEIRELTIPNDNLAVHVSQHLEDLAQIIKLANAMPGAGAAHPEPRMRRKLQRAAPYCLAGLLLSFALLVSARKAEQPADSPSVTSEALAGVPSEDASKIHDSQGWRLMDSDDFDQHGEAWLRQQGQTAEGRIVAPFGSNGTEGSAYLLKSRQEQSCRLVILVGGDVRYDATMPAIALAARIPRSALSRVEWRGHELVNPPDGDGLLVVRNFGDPGSGMIFFVSGVQTIVRIPADYRTISLY